MHIVAVGLNYRTAPVEIRERFAFSGERLPEALQLLRQTKSVMECVILGTCNRTELYVVVDRKTLCGHYLLDFIEKWFGIEREDFHNHLYLYEDRKAIEHLFRVTCGLDSMVIGETQILGQVRDAFLLAQRQQTTGSMFNTLFKQAVTLAKRAHSETSIGENPVSVSYAAIELSKRIFGSFDGKSVLIVGAGKMSELTAVHLNGSGVGQVTVVNRTMARAEELASKFGGRALPYERLIEAIGEADIVISSTGSADYVLTKEQVASTLLRRKARPLFMMDIAVPRDLDPGIGELENVFLYDIDDLEMIVESNLAERRKVAAKIETMIEADIAVYEQWLKTLGVAPVIQALQTKAGQIHEETLDSLLNKLPDLDERQIKVIRKLTKSMMNQLLRDPIVRVKELAGERHGDQAVELVTKLFALEELVVTEDRAETVRADAASDSQVVLRRAKELFAGT